VSLLWTVELIRADLEGAEGEPWDHDLPARRDG
jgi:hypothetical protein